GRQPVLVGDRVGEHLAARLDVDLDLPVDDGGALGRVDEVDGEPVAGSVGVEVVVEDGDGDPFLVEDGDRPDEVVDGHGWLELGVGGHVHRDDPGRGAAALVAHVV